MIDCIELSDNSKERYVVHSAKGWEKFTPLKTGSDENSFSDMLYMYEKFILGKYLDLYRHIIVFSAPKSMDRPFVYGKTKFLQKGAVASLVLSELGSGDPSPMAMRSVGFVAEEIFDAEMFDGPGNDVKCLPLSSDFGCLSKYAGNSECVFNSHFFLFDPTDIETPFDEIGTPYGLFLKNGRIIYPPLLSREALLVKENGEVTIRSVSLKEISVKIQGKSFTHGVNATFYERPGFKRTPKEKGYDIVVSGNRVVAVSEDGEIPVPMAGFVIHTDEKINGYNIEFSGLEDYVFGIQVGPAVLIDGEETGKFVTPYYDGKPKSIAYPPTLYPSDFSNDRAPRMILASDEYNKPFIIWAEGAPKTGYEKEVDSPGLSLSETGKLCAKLGFKNAINLDGGGSAEMFIKGMKPLRVSQRNDDGSDFERPVPLGIAVSE